MPRIAMLTIIAPPLLLLLVVAYAVVKAGGIEKVIAENNKIRVLVVTGGHEFEREPFFSLFKGYDDIVYQEVEHPKVHEFFKPEVAKQYDVIVLYDLWQDITDEAKLNFLSLLKEGKGIVALHHSLASYQGWAEYAKIIAGKFYMQPHINEGGKEKPASTFKHGVKFTVHIVDPTHPVTQGLKDFEILDETYGNFNVSTQQVKPLLTTDEPTSGKIIGWTHNYLNSRVVYIQLGHDHTAYENPNYRRLVAQAIRWTAVNKQYDTNSFVFKLAQPRPHKRKGSILAVDVNNDGLLDFLYTVPGSVGAYDHFGKVLWVKQVDIHLTGQSEAEGLPGLHAPGVQAADVDGDGTTEVLFLTTDGSVVICDGATGQEKRRAKPAIPEGIARWEHLVVCNLRGRGDRDVVLQATPQASGFKLGRFVSALAIEDLEGKPLWSTSRFCALAHGPLRAADIDGDGRDEICGLGIYDDDGTLLTGGNPPQGAWHIDLMAIADVRLELPWLEVSGTVEGTRHVGLFGVKGGIWWHLYGHREADKIAVGEFDHSRAGLEIWGRGSFDSEADRGQFVFDAQGNVIAFYELYKVAPKDWTADGVEVIWTIDWTGKPKQLLAAKERHKEGNVCIFEPLTGKFIERFKEYAARLYVADVSGDWREELVVANGDEVHIYWNPKPNPSPSHKRLWTENRYRPNKLNWNYYSP